jgi:hypothetical protein
VGGSLTKLAVLVWLCTCHPGRDLLDVETCSKSISDEWLFITDSAVRSFKYCVTVGWSV